MELGLFQKPKIDLGDISQFKVPWLMECRRYAFLYGQLEKFHKQGNNNFYMSGVMKQLTELLETAKILNPAVRTDFLKKAEDWYGQATQPKGKRKEQQRDTRESRDAEHIPSIMNSPITTHKQIRPQSSINRLSNTPVISRPLTAVLNRKLVRPQSCKKTQASTKVTQKNLNNETNLVEQDNSIETLKVADLIELQSADYYNNHRTVHPHLDPPCDFYKKKINDTGTIKKIIEKVSRKSIKNKENTGITRVFQQEQLTIGQVGQEESEEEVVAAEQILEIVEQKNKLYSEERPTVVPSGICRTFSPIDNIRMKNQREDEEMVQMINQWRKTKSRMAHEESRRIASAKCARPTSAKIMKKITMADERIVDFRSKHQTKKEITRRPITRIKTQNRYGRPDTLNNNLTMASRMPPEKNTRHYDPQDPELIDKQNQQNMNLIDQIRRRLNKNVNMSLKSLMNALIYDSPKETTLKNYPYHYMMISNPFMKKKKKKTKRL